jgi:hypothetical protein
LTSSSKKITSTMSPTTMPTTPIFSRAATWTRQQSWRAAGSGFTAGAASKGQSSPRCAALPAP